MTRYCINYDSQGLDTMIDTAIFIPTSTCSKVTQSNRRCGSHHQKQKRSPETTSSWRSGVDGRNCIPFGIKKRQPVALASVDGQLGCGHLLPPTLDFLF